MGLPSRWPPAWPISSSIRVTATADEDDQLAEQLELSGARTNLAAVDRHEHGLLNADGGGRDV